MPQGLPNQTAFALGNEVYVWVNDIRPQSPQIRNDFARAAILVFEPGRRCCIFTVGHLPGENFNRLVLHTCSAYCERPNAVNVSSINIINLGSIVGSAASYAFKQRVLSQCVGNFGIIWLLGILRRELYHEYLNPVLLRWVIRQLEARRI
ncbi:hypothetical protein BY996DRAFT_6427779 [Phakopsora pachyrhizi]|uniref:Uncharacterized protein n=1 Tax=Phakopsora pachyrhizi TaxID=170000 RepID=A0AAV0AS73_PHAPC|nr:hypothetical protein BY996DRAFT_6427779 [Phakopsora pachyrhizi]CAH7670676.1 hypothetical protein PPACK8108_LOCUS5393 [Phakopsora pachyrhizi]